MTAELILLPKGTIRWVEFLARPLKRKMSLGRRCAHADDTGPCTNLAITRGHVHGWLCKVHLELETSLQPKPKVARRDPDQEVIDSIIATETRAIRRMRCQK